MNLLLSELQLINLWATNNKYFGHFNSLRGLVNSVRSGLVSLNGKRVVISNSMTESIPMAYTEDQLRRMYRDELKNYHG
jgi:hypothetical protein